MPSDQPGDFEGTGFGLASVDLELTRSSRRFPRSRAAQTRRHPHRVVTSSAAERDRVETYQLGVISDVVKPIEFDSFVRTIGDLGFYWMAINKLLLRS